MWFLESEGCLVSESTYSCAHRIRSTKGSLRAVRRMLSIDRVIRARTRRVLLIINGDRIKMAKSGIKVSRMFEKHGEKKKPSITVNLTWQISRVQCAGIEFKQIKDYMPAGVWWNGISVQWIEQIEEHLAGVCGLCLWGCGGVIINS